MTDIFIKMIKSKNKVMSSIPPQSREDSRKSVENQTRYNINKVQNYESKLKTKEGTKNLVKGIHNIPIRSTALEKNKENSLPPNHSYGNNSLNRKSTKDLNENIQKLKSNPIKPHSINNIRSSFAKQANKRQFGTDLSIFQGSNQDE